MAKRKKPPTTPTRDPRLDAMVGDGTGAPDERVTRAAPPKPPSNRREDKPGKRWDQRILRACKVYDKWSDKYECKHLDDYYEGQQWRGITEEAARKRYVINLIFATVESQIPSLLFSQPKVKVEARPTHEQTDQSQAGTRATLIEQTLQTFIENPSVHFSFETTLALRDAYSRFAVVEVGYSADWIDNPNADKPLLKEDNTPLMEGSEPVLAPKRLLKPGTRESLYIKRIDPDTFRASPGHNTLTSNDWAGYYEWLPLEDVKRNPAYQHTDTLRAGGSLLPTIDDDHERLEEEDEASRRVGLIKVWKIWDLRAKERIVHAEGHAQLLQTQPFEFCNLAVLKFYERRNAFYPLPPVYNWMSPQDEINETREMQKVHRRRAVRRYMHDARVQGPELEKLESNEDMTMIQVADLKSPPIVPLQDAPLDVQNWTELAASRDDLNQISGVSGEARNSPSAPTATQANIINVRASIRESRARQQVADWLAEIGRLMLLTLRDKMRLPFMVKQTVDPFAFPNDPQQVLGTAQTWKQIEAEDVSELDVDITIDVASLSPVAEDAQRNQWNVVLTLLTNPALASIIFTPNPQAPDDPSPMLRKTLVLNGVTSDQEIREIWRVGQAIIAQAAAAAKAAAALAKQPEPPKVSIALKIEDIILALGPAAPTYIAQLLGMGQQPMLDAAQIAQPESPLMGSGAAGGLSVPAPGGVPTGTPSSAPTGVA